MGDLSKEEKQKQSTVLGFVSAAMIAVGYPGEMIIDPPYGTRWACWFFSMCVFSYIVYTLLKGLDAAHQKEIAADERRSVKAAPLIHLAKVMTVISWCTYPVVYIFPMIACRAPRPSSASRSATASPTSSRSAVSAFSPTRSASPRAPRDFRSVRALEGKF